ncbi:hypothetical protein [Bradyrhizobium sp. RT9a]|uniref:hypothetical protein n=1 Tax=Bradyrhizobium sp. RT9a TaxID=3156384 RepID=UPI0033937F26
MRDLIALGIAAVVLIGGCLFEGWYEARVGDRAQGRSRTWLAVALALLLLAAALLGARYARARDVDGRFAASPLKPWFDSLRSGKGPCCSDADGYALADVDWETRDRHYRVRIPRSNDPADKGEMVWLDVPEDALITEPNRAGRTMVWPIWGYQGPSIRCFIPGSMT